MLALPQWVSALLPGLLVAGIGPFVVPLLSRTTPLHRVPMFLLAAFFSLRYLIWRFTET